MANIARQHTDPNNDTVDWMHPIFFGAKANSEDTPLWEEAMNGPDCDGYWEACEKELSTLQDDKDTWDVVAWEHWMNVLPYTWALSASIFLMDAFVS